MKFLCKEQKLVLLRRRLFFSFLCECVSCSYDATAAKSPLFEVNSIQFRGKEKFNLLSLVYGLKKNSHQGILFLNREATAKKSDQRSVRHHARAVRAE